MMVKLICFIHRFVKITKQIRYRLIGTQIIKASKLMIDRMDGQQSRSQKQTRALRKMFIYLKPNITEKCQLVLQKLHANSIIKSNAFKELKTAEFFKRVNKLYMIKLRLYFITLNANTLITAISKKQIDIDSTKARDRFYEAKVKSLRVLSRQWKERKTQTAYKNKYFTPKAQQTPKMQRQKVIEQVYIVLRTLLRNKYLKVLNMIKCTEVIRMMRSKGAFLGNYLMEKRRYLLVNGIQSLKLNMLIIREQKHKEEILQLDTKLGPINDPELQSLKQKQQKLQSALDAVYRQKQTVTKQVDEQIIAIQHSLQSKRVDLLQLKDNKQILLRQLQEFRQRNDKYVFTRQEIFYSIFNCFIAKLKLWSEVQAISDTVSLDKKGVLGWLLVPSVRFNLDKIYIKTQQELNDTVMALSTLIKQYQQQANYNSTLFNYPQVFLQFFFSSNGMPSTYQSLLTENKFLHKMIAQILKQNTTLIDQMLQQIGLKHTKVAQQNPLIIQNQPLL